MLRCYILSTVLLVTLGQSIPLAENSAGNESLNAIGLLAKQSRDSISKNVQPNAYKIELEPHLIAEDFTFTGKSNISITVLDGDTTNKITLHAADLKINKDSVSLASEYGSTIVKPTNLNTTTELLTIEFEKEIAAGNYTLHLEFSGELGVETKGFYRIWRKDAKPPRWEATTQFRHSYARRAFPCFDDPAIKALFTISIKCRENYMATSEVLRTEESNDLNKTWTVFEARDPISTDDIDFNIVYDEKVDEGTVTTESPSPSPSTSSSSTSTESPSPSPSTNSSSTSTESPSPSPSTSSSSTSTESPSPSPSTSSSSTSTESPSPSPSTSSSSTSTESPSPSPSTSSSSTSTESPSPSPSTSSSSTSTESPSPSPSTSSSSTSTESPSPSPSTSSSSTSTGSASTSPSASSSPGSEVKPEASTDPNSAPNISLPTLPVTIFIGLLARLVTRVL